jgi:gamma-glutamylcysteine synthetase
MEETKGFNEAVFKKDKSEKIKFFNLGIENNYKNLLNTNLISQMNELYKPKLLKFNYEL